MLVVVEDRDLHPLAALALDVEALGRLDVLEVDAAERRLERGDHVDELVGVALVDLDVEAVDAGELLEQHRLAFHHRLAGERADVPSPSTAVPLVTTPTRLPRAVRLRASLRIADDLVARGGDAGRVGEREVALVGELLGRPDRDLARRRAPVILERGLADVLVGVVGHGGSRRRRRAEPR